jgi:hypothetical protein
MPVTRSDPDQTSFAGKMRVYLVAHAAKQHQRQFGWQNFRVLVVTIDRQRISSMVEAARRLRATRVASVSLFLFATYQELRDTDPLSHTWLDAEGRQVALI